MASVGRALGRSFLSTTRSALRACKASGSEAVGGTVKGKSPCAPSYVPSPSSSSLPPMRRPVSYFTRLPGEVAAIQSLLPFHSATASSRLVAQLSSTAGALFQGGLWIIDDS
ncbi:uncharacterized protein [Physcomitrium patens]|uniref:Uncharacterized protein n=1 Tax=Physcomitrium patens TaxID=3218 RepID=A0A2K1IJV3_PHYPA|nr:protein NUCLEAR FUSION DEFECTIVE 6, chloroplastic/mitochondrial-like isoform X2 [Physcomitrium patens]PNR29559.1 hypothetical protein PHYPA_028253 [Physcomitrium patens]|eukprot:XP_024362329.1 protein NUCLEAR FUSION DEFECTIVE 6, chloroplastic/mitochondrial-like isoform X2 [Physcomitrella patens]